MIRTLAEPKKSIISSIRQKLLQLGFLEEVEYDAINIEPVLIYSRSENQALFLKHKWELVALIPLQSNKIRERVFGEKTDTDLKKFKSVDEDGNQWLKFALPKDQEMVIQAVEALSL